MSDNLDMITLVGVGPMAQAYAMVLDAMKVPYQAIGRGAASAEKFKELTGKEVYTGGLHAFFAAGHAITPKCIVAVEVSQLAAVTLQLIKAGAKSILVEKPAGMNLAEIESITEQAKANDVDVFVAYNRRFYASVQHAKRLIEADGGVSSFNFEFTEWSHVIRDVPKAEGVKEAWFLANSTHVVDMAFYLGGMPQSISAYQAGGLDWHSKASRFAGAGVTTAGALFSYQANWEAPGRWSVEILTTKNRYIFRPLEQLCIQKLGSVAIEKVGIDDKIDLDFKAGLYEQTAAFLNENVGSPLLSIAEHLRITKDVYLKILP